MLGSGRVKLMFPELRAGAWMVATEQKLDVGMPTVSSSLLHSGTDSGTVAEEGSAAIHDKHLPNSHCGRPWDGCWGCPRNKRETLLSFLLIQLSLCKFVFTSSACTEHLSRAR